MLRQKQGYQIEAMNADMTGEKALKLKQLAKAMQGDVQQSKMTIAQTKSANKILQRQQESVFGDRGILRKEFFATSKQNRNKIQALDDKLMDTKRQINTACRRWSERWPSLLKDSSLQPSGAEDLTGLYIQTQASIDQASMPYRKSIIFDPLEPIAACRRSGSRHSIHLADQQYANAIMGGVQTALVGQMTSMAEVLLTSACV